MRTKHRLLVGITVGFVSTLPLVVGCSNESATSGGGGGSGGAPASGGASGVSGTTSGGTAGASGGTTSGGTTSGGTSGSGGTVAGAGSGGAGTSGGTGGEGGSATGGGGSGSGGMSGGTGGSGGASGSGGAGGSGGGGGSTGFTLTSPDHAEGAMFATPYTCAMAGFNGSILPELRWSGAPAGTMSYAITFIDRTLAPANMNGYHWVIWNIPAATTGLPEGFKDQATIMAQENRDFLGPCPNFGGGSANTDTYEFTIYALAQASITVTPTTGTMAVANAETMLEANNLGKAKLSGTSNASPP